MQQLELNEQQKEQLLKMCNKLFKEVNNKSVREVIMSDKNQRCHFHSSDDAKTYIYIADKYGFPITHMPWFEFCLLHIAPKIFKLKDEQEIEPECIEEDAYFDVLYICVTSKIHPIDYLYKQFKLLKL